MQSTFVLFRNLAVESLFFLPFLTVYFNYSFLKVNVQFFFRIY